MSFKPFRCCPQLVYCGKPKRKARAAPSYSRPDTSYSSRDPPFHTRAHSEAPHLHARALLLSSTDYKIFEIHGWIEQSSPSPCQLQGADPGFSNRWGANSYVPTAHIPRHEAQSPLRPGSMQGPFEGTGISIVLDALSCYMSLI